MSADRTHGAGGEHAHDEHPEDWAGAGRDDAVTSSLGIPLGAARAAFPTTEPLFERPQMRVVRGTPDDDELAALVAGLMAARAVAQSRAEADAALRVAGFVPDYAVIRRPDFSEPVDGADGERVALIAARLGRTRLIDNLEFDLPG